MKPMRSTFGSPNGVCVSGREPLIRKQGQCANELRLIEFAGEKSVSTISAPCHVLCKIVLLSLALIKFGLLAHGRERSVVSSSRSEIDVLHVSMSPCSLSAAAIRADLHARLNLAHSPAVRLTC